MSYKEDVNLCNDFKIKVPSLNIDVYMKDHP